MLNLDLKRLTLQQTAALLCLSTRQVNNLVGKGVITKQGSGKTSRYVWSEVFDGYLSDRLAQLRGPKSNEDVDNQAEAELRRTNADARLKELKADEMEGKLVDIAFVGTTLRNIYTNARARLVAMPSKLTPQLVGVDSPPKVKAIVEKETNQVIEELRELAESPRRGIKDDDGSAE